MEGHVVLASRIDANPNVESKSTVQERWIDPSTFSVKAINVLSTRIEAPTSIIIMCIVHEDSTIEKESSHEDILNGMSIIGMKKNLLPVLPTFAMLLDSRHIRLLRQRLEYHQTS